MSLSTLALNLQEIHFSGKNPLVPDSWETRVFDSSCLEGKVCSWFLSLCGKDAKKALNQALQKTVDIFYANIPLIEQAAKTYEVYLSGQEYEKKDWLEARNLLNEWDKSTAPFLKAIEKAPHKKIPGITWDPKFERFQNLQHLVDLEGDLHEPLPVKILQQLAGGATLSERDDYELKRWIEELNSNNDIKIGPFQKAMSVLVNQDTSRLTRLEYALLEKGLINLFKQKDPEHIEWRKKLEPGKPLDPNEPSIILGDQIGKKKDVEKDLNIVFERQDAPDQVVVIGVNRANSRLKEIKGEESWWGIQYVKPLHTDPQGRFVIKEQLRPIESQDRERVAQLIQWFIKQNGVPEGFVPEQLMVNEEGHPRYHKPLNWDEFSFVKLEDLAYRTFKGPNFASLMETSELTKHRYWTFYEKMINFALDGEQRLENRDTDLEGVVEPLVARRGNSLYGSVQKLRELALNSASLEEIQQEQMRQYDINKCTAILMPELLNKVRKLRK